MPYTLKIESRSTYLFITVTGDNSFETVNSYLSEIHKLCQQQDCRDVLIAENLSGPSLPTSSIYELVSGKSRQPEQVVRRLAYVDTNTEHDQAAMQFAEDVAVNRGISVRVFPTIQAAEAWLESQ